MILLNKEQIKSLHNKMIRETGGSNGIRDEGLLDSALSAPFQSFGGMELYPFMIGKAARLCYGLIKTMLSLMEINALVFMLCWFF